MNTGNVVGAVIIGVVILFIIVFADGGPRNR